METEEAVQVHTHASELCCVEFGSRRVHGRVGTLVGSRDRRKRAVAVRVGWEGLAERGERENDPSEREGM